jgi:hypothetical protein
MVDSVNGQTGAVVLEIDDLDNVNITVPAPGNKLRFDGTNWVNIIDNIDSLQDVDTTSAPPTVGQILVWNGTNWVPSSTTPQNLSIVSVSTTYTAVLANDLILGDATSAGFTITIFTAVGNTGKQITVNNVGTANVLTIDANASETISGSLTKALLPGESLSIVSDGANWTIVSFKGRNIVTQTSSIKSVLGNVHFHSLVGASFTLTQGRWMIFGQAFFVNRAGGALNISRHGLNFYGANGSDSGSIPGLNLSGVSGVTVLSVGPPNTTFASFIPATSTGGDQGSLNTGPILIDVTAATSGNIFLVTYMEGTNPTDARITAYLNAAKIGD